MRSRGYARSRYRGSRRPSPLLWLLLAAAAAAALFLAFRFSRAQRPPEPPGDDVPALAPAGSGLSASGGDSSAPDASGQPAPSLPALPAHVRGIYITGPMAGSAGMEALTALVEETELNAVVIDVKNDVGNLTYLPDGGTARELGAGVRYIPDLPGLVASLKGKGIYTIARLSSFKDPLLAGARPELALRRADGSPLSEGGGEAWVNPYEPAVWDYLTGIALDAARAGFDEVQLDYVRFPAVRDIGSVDFGPAAGETGREEIICQFLSHVRDALHAQGVRLSADVFGTVIDSALDAGLIGQNYLEMARSADFLCPMVYPSHYAAGVYGLEVPDSQPYETVLAALERSRAALSPLEEGERAGVRAWLQGFTASWVKGHIPYGGEQLRAQIQAVYDAGYTDWIIWNAANTYSGDGLLPASVP